MSPDTPEMPGAPDSPAPPESGPTPEPRPRGHFFKGFGLGFLLHLFQILAMAQPFLFALFGVTQLLYIIPAAIHFQRRGETDTVKGLVTAAAVSFISNAACWGIAMVSLNNMR